MRLLLFLLVVIPACEIGVFILSGKLIGVVPTVLLILLTGITGAWLAKKQGLKTMQKFQDDLRQGRFPNDAIMDGMIILAGGIMLLTPGFLTDISGFLLLFPKTRNLLKPFIIQWVQKWINKHTIVIR